MRMEPHPVQAMDYVRARTLRQRQTPMEKILWDKLRETAAAKGHKFRRQHPIHPYIVDFVCLGAKLIVEIDGDSHDLSCDYDKKRTAYLENLGYTVLRFSNDDVKLNVEGVVSTIMNETEAKSGQERTADLTERVIEALHAVYDPEIPVNIYDLGLIYGIEIKNAQAEKPDLLVEMTLTTANCPMADMIPGMVHQSLALKIPEFNEIEIKLVWEPAWDPSRMSDEARLELDMY